MDNRFNYLYEFDSYRLDPRERAFYKGSKLVPLAPKVFDTLCLLVERSGETVLKEELLDTIWKDAFVEENNLSQNISALRKVFGKEHKFIETVPRKGYRFVKQVKRIPADNAQPPKTDDTSIRAVDPSPVTSSWKRNRVVLGSIVGMILVTVIGVSAFRFLGVGKGSESKAPLASFDYRELTDVRLVISSAISPDGDFIAYVKRDDDRRSNRTSLHLMELESGNTLEVKIEGDTQPDFVDFGSEGKFIYYRAREAPDKKLNVFRVSILGGKPEVVMEDIDGNFNISPDGTKLVHCKSPTASRGRKIAVFDIENKKETLVFENASGENCRPQNIPAISPSGNEIAYVPTRKLNENANIFIYDFDSKEKKIFETPFRFVRNISWSPDGTSLFLNAYKRGEHYQLWNFARSTGDVTRVTSDGDAYRNMHISADGTKISANRIQLLSNLWILPSGDLSRAKQLTSGENELAGLSAAQFMPDNRILFIARRENNEGTWITDIDGSDQRRLNDTDIGIQRSFGFLPSKELTFFSLENRIWRMNFDGSDVRRVELDGKGRKFLQTVSPDEQWLYYASVEKGEAAIRRKSLNGDSNELVLKLPGFVPQSFLSVSPDGNFLATLLRPNIRNPEKPMVGRNFRRFSFIDLATKEIRAIETNANQSLIRWTNGGKTFDYTGFTENGTAIFRKRVEGGENVETILELPGENIFNFDWSSDGKYLVIGRGKYRMNVVLLSSQ